MESVFSEGAMKPARGEHLQSIMTGSLIETKQIGNIHSCICVYCLTVASAAFIVLSSSCGILSPQFHSCRS